MNDPLTTIDDHIIDRLVDGELGADERRDLLLALEAQPSGWRRCALAFLEAQAWRHEMRQVVASTMIKEKQTAAAACGEPTVTRSKMERKPHRRLYFSSVASLAIAASLLVAFGLGRHFAYRDASLRDRIASHQALAVADQAPASGDAVTLVVNDQQGVPHRVRVPLVEGRRLGAQFADTPTWSESPELTRQLNEQGLGLTARRRYAPMYFEQQNQLVPMIVPVDDAVVTPVSRPVF
jgi:hypothetical protein